MHVALVIVGGLALLAIFLLFGWLWGASAAGMALAGKVFAPIWFLVAAVNMWIGVQYAGYSAREEFPIMLLVFAVPAVAAGTAAWWLSRG